MPFSVCLHSTMSVYVLSTGILRDKTITTNWEGKGRERNIFEAGKKRILYRIFAPGNVPSSLSKTAKSTYAIVKADCQTVSVCIPCLSIYLFVCLSVLYLIWVYGYWVDVIGVCVGKYSAGWSFNHQFHGFQHWHSEKKVFVLVG